MKRYFVTGASRGIGRSIARKLAGKGTHIYLHGRDREALAVSEALVKEAGGKSTLVVADLSTPEGVNSAIASLDGQPVHLLVNNAGIATVKPVADITLEDWQRSFAVNVTAPFLLSQKLCPNMPEGASIVNIMSIAARTGFQGWSAYCMSKFALEGFTQSLREELRPHGIRVINIYPSAINTDIWDSVEGDWPRDRMMDPVEVAEALAYTLSRPSDVLVDTINIGSIAGTL